MRRHRGMTAALMAERCTRVLRAVLDVIVMWQVVAMRDDVRRQLDELGAAGRERE